jgi:hypothetical protein
MFGEISLRVLFGGVRAIWQVDIHEELLERIQIVEIVDEEMSILE